MSTEDSYSPVTSTPTISQFNPKFIPSQIQVVKDVRKNFDYVKNGVQEILLSGSVGSSKSILCAHLIVTHCLLYAGAIGLLCRRTMPSLKKTILKKVVDHIGNDVDYRFNKVDGTITFSNGSQILCHSWADQKHDKVRSLELSCAVVEELTENESMDFYHEIKMRIGRLSHVKENFIISATNPGSPSSDFYKYFIAPGGENRHVYYSLTKDNPFLPSFYIDGLMASLDAKMAERMLEGKWTEISTEVVYYAYDRNFNFINKPYVINKQRPVYMAWDFNIGDGKPLSVGMIQHEPDQTHVYNEIVIEGQRTLDACESAWDKGLLPKDQKIIIHGDATGRHRDTRSLKSDYAIIENFLSKHNLNFEIDVPTANPPIRQRHNLVNGRICNANNKRGLFVYKDAPTADEGFRLTALKKGGQLIENDSKAYQHITTSVGYSVCQYLKGVSTQDRTIQSLTRFGIGIR